MPDRVRLRFSKRGALRYIGHLDLLRVFQRTIRRARLPAAYSQGFNPHMLISFALPLPLGMESVRDYADWVIDEPMAMEEIIGRINQKSPEGLTVTGARLVTPDEPRAAAVTAGADYSLRFNGKIIENDLFRAQIELDRLLSETSITAVKKTKTGEKETDIRPDIWAAAFTAGPEPALTLRLAAGSTRFLHPGTAAGVIFERLGWDTPARDIRRLEMYRYLDAGGGAMVASLFDVPGEEKAIPFDGGREDGV